MYRGHHSVVGMARKTAEHGEINTTDSRDMMVRMAPSIAEDDMDGKEDSRRWRGRYIGQQWMDRVT